MCKCCQLCLEDLYWQCFEEKFCYDESIANYDPNEDEYYRANGHVINGGETLDNNNQPITVQPSARIQRHNSTCSGKIHENDVRREVQTANVNLPPEIVQVFANSQIFYDHKPIKTISPPPNAFSIGAVKIEKSIEKAKLQQINEEDSNKLLKRLEEEDDAMRDKRTPPTIIETPAINEDGDEDEDEIDNEVVLRPSRSTTVTSNEEVMLSNVVNKRLQLDSPYFTQRPASENDIFTISSQKERPTLASVSSTSDVNRFSMTPEVPSITFAHLPKNYLDTPAIEKFKKKEMTLAELQERESELRKSEVDFSMPRYYGKSELVLNSSNLSIASLASVSSLAKKHVERSKRLKQLRAHIPPLMIHKDKHEKEK